MPHIVWCFLYPKNILANIYENPTTLNTLLINLSMDNPQKKQTLSFWPSKKFPDFYTSFKGV